MKDTVLVDGVDTKVKNICHFCPKEVKTSEGQMTNLQAIPRARNTGNGILPNYFISQKNRDSVDLLEERPAETYHHRQAY